MKKPQLKIDAATSHLYRREPDEYAALKAVNDSDEDRPFPFDVPTLEIYGTYECPFWETRTGVGQLAQVLFLRESDLIGMLAFYGDGSGEHGRNTSKIFVVAGYLASTLDWFQIERSWCQALSEEPTIKYFKARECIRHRGDFSGEFKGWSERDVNQKRIKMAEVIRTHGRRMVELSSTIRWDESVIGDDAVKQLFYHPLHFCFHGVKDLAVERADAQFVNDKSRIAFVMDTEGKYLDVDVEAQYRYSHETLPKRVADRLGSLTWDSDIKFPMLQTADLLAWTLRSEHEALPSPVRELIRSQINGSFHRPWRSSRMAQFVVETEEAYHRMFPNG